MAEKLRKLITHEEEVVGIIVGYSDYIDNIFIKPEHRRKGIAKEAVLAYVEGNLDKGIKFHMLNSNEEGLAFFNSLFELKVIHIGAIDTLYEIVKVKEVSDEATT